MLDGLPDLPSLVAVSVYDTNNVHFISTWYNTIQWVHKIQQLYDHKTKMVCDTHCLSLNINDSYCDNINSVDLSDQLRNVY